MTGATPLDLLAFNWRDPRHPEAGGAEVHLHELLRRFAAGGSRVTQLASGFAGASAEEDVDGVRVLRRGRWFDANWSLRRAYQRELTDRHFDVVIEDINKIPFFTPLFVRHPILVIVPHLFGTTVFRETAAPLAAYVFAHEALIPLVYRRARFLVISESTRADLVARGLDPGRIRVVPVGLDHDLYRPDPRVPKAERPLIVYLGRVRRYKGIQHLIEAMPIVRRQIPAATLVVAGDGPHRAVLARRAAGVPGVEIRGFVPAREKVDLLRRAWVTVCPSAKEGFGLTVIEGNACGTPVVATRVPGLVDAVREGVSGLLVPFGQVGSLATALIRVLEDHELRARLIAGGLDWARGFTWERAAREALDVVRWTREESAG